MATIIEQIIAIDQDAQKRLDEASRFQALCTEETEKQIAEIKAQILSETAEKLNKIRQEEQEKAQREQAEFSHRSDEAFRLMQTQYEQKKDALVQDLFHRVIH